MAVTLYYAGLGGSLCQLAPYVTGRCVLLKDGSFAASKAPVQLDEDIALPPVYLGETPDGGDVEPYDMYALSGRAWPSLVVWLATFPYRRVTWWMTHTESTLNVVGPLPWRLNVGQAGDRAHALAYTRRAMAASPTTQQFVLFGRSRGSAVALDVFVLLTDAERARVSLVLLEGTFEHSEDVLDTRYAHRPWVHRAALAFLRWCGGGWKGAQEREAAVFGQGRLEHALRTSTCPIAIVTSAADWPVPPSNAANLKRRLEAAGISRDRLHWLQLERADHSNYATSDAEDAARYSDFLRPLLAGR